MFIFRKAKAYKMLSVGDLVKKSQPALFWCMHGISRPKREALFTLFAFCRHIDALAHSAMPIKEKQELIKAWREELVNIYEKNVPATNIGRKIYKNCLRFNLPQQKWAEILECAVLNVPKPLKAPERIIFEQYLDSSAVIPFELALKIISGKNSVANSELAKDLGRAIMMTLILRDVKDDAKAGRLYLPKDILKQAEIASFEPLQAVEDTNFAYARQLLAGEAALAFLKADRLLNKLPKKDTFALRYVKNTCSYLFDTMQKRGWEIISPKPRLNVFNRLSILLQTLF